MPKYKYLIIKGALALPFLVSYQHVVADEKIVKGKAATAEKAPEIELPAKATFNMSPKEFANAFNRIAASSESNLPYRIQFQDDGKGHIYQLTESLAIVMFDPYRGRMTGVMVASSARGTEAMVTACVAYAALMETSVKRMTTEVAGLAAEAKNTARKKKESVRYFNKTKLSHQDTPQLVTFSAAAQ